VTFTSLTGTLELASIFATCSLERIFSESCLVVVAMVPGDERYMEICAMFSLRLPYRKP
jgi:hypothetical protein